MINYKQGRRGETPAAALLGSRREGDLHRAGLTTLAQRNGWIPTTSIIQSSYSQIGFTPSLNQGVFTVSTSYELINPIQAKVSAGVSGIVNAGIQQVSGQVSNNIKKLDNNIN